MKAVSDVPQRKVKSPKISAIHNCCRLCCEAIKKAIATVDGVTGDTAKPQATTFELIGDFDSAAVVDAHGRMLTKKMTVKTPKVCPPNVMVDMLTELVKSLPPHRPRVVAARLMFW